MPEQRKEVRHHQSVGNEYRRPLRIRYRPSTLVTVSYVLRNTHSAVESSEEVEVGVKFF
jgi:hypothetical protein